MSINKINCSRRRDRSSVSTNFSTLVIIKYYYYYINFYNLLEILRKYHALISIVPVFLLCINMVYDFYDVCISYSDNINDDPFFELAMISSIIASMGEKM